MNDQVLPRDNTPHPRQALLVIDVLQGIFELPVSLHDEEGFLDRLCATIQAAREVQIPIVYLQHTGPPGSPFERGSAGWQIHPRLAPHGSDRVIAKEHPDAFQGTALDPFLRESGVGEIIVAGFATEGCIDTTVRSGYSLGYRVVLVADGHTTTDGEVLSAPQIIAHHNAVLARFATVQAHDTDLFASQT